MSKIPLYTTSELVARHDWLTMGMLRKLIFESDQNGFARCITRVGKKILINEETFLLWLDETNGRNPQDPTALFQKYNKEMAAPRGRAAGANE